MTIEQAIASYEKSAERYHKAFLHCKAHGGKFYQEEAESNKICYEHDRQLADWLRELQERRKAPEIIYCKDCRKHNVRVGYEVSLKQTGEMMHAFWRTGVVRHRGMSTIISIVFMRKGEPRNDEVGS